jgi:4-methylaminobutanoate oxidase (formaldehyde-forming)
MPQGGEAISLDGCVIGRVTSGGYGYSVGTAIAYGYLPAEHTAVGTRVCIEVLGERVEACVAREPLYDPRGEKLRS